MKCKFGSKCTLKTLLKAQIIFKNNLEFFPFNARSLESLNRSWKPKLTIKQSRFDWSTNWLTG